MTEPFSRATTDDERVERLDIRHLGRVIWKWRILVLAGTLFVATAAVALLRVTEPAFQAETVVLFDQPALVARAEGGLAAASKLLNLLPTYARIATSDPVMSDVRDQLGSGATLDELKRRIEARPIPDTLALQIVARDEDAEVAERLAAATAAALGNHFEAMLEAADLPEESTFVLTTLVEPDAERPGRNEARTVILAALLGLLVMVGLAFFLEYIEQPEGGSAA